MSVKPIILVVLAFLLGIYVGNKIYPQPKTEDLKQLNAQDNNSEKQAELKDKVSWLPLNVEYFSEKDVAWGSAGNYKTETGIKQYTSAAIDNIAVYQSYPTQNTTIKKYSSEVIPLRIKTFQEIRQELPAGESEAATFINPDLLKNNFDKYGKLASNYLPEKYIVFTKEFDVDGDGSEETIVITNFSGAADGGSYETDIVKNNKIIFRVDEDNSEIIQSEINNGFYVEWRGNSDAPRCCEEGFVRTRFIYKDGEFLPIFEQEVKYLKIGSDN